MGEEAGNFIFFLFFCDFSFCTPFPGCGTGDARGCVIRNEEARWGGRVRMGPICRKSSDPLKWGACWCRSKRAPVAPASAPREGPERYRPLGCSTAMETGPWARDHCRSQTVLVHGSLLSLVVAAGTIWSGRWPSGGHGVTCGHEASSVSSGCPWRWGRSPCGRCLGWVRPEARLRGEDLCLP